MRRTKRKSSKGITGVEKINPELEKLAVPISKLKQDTRNARVHNKRNIESIKGSLSQFGQQKPIVALKSGKVIAGNGTLLAAAELGWKIIACVRFDTDDEARAAAYAIADNRTGELAEWDDEHLTEILNELKNNEFDLGSIGFDSDDLTILNGNDEDEDDVIKVPSKSRAKKGQLFRLGKHRLLCADSSDEVNVKRVLQNNVIDIVFTDPPYGIDYGKKNRFLNTFQKAGRCLKDIAGDTISKDDLFLMLNKAFLLAWKFGDEHCSYYVTAPQGGELGLMMMMMMASNLAVRHVLIWNKNSQNFSLGRLDYEYKHEPILYTWKTKHRFYGKGEFLNSVWDVDKERKCNKHPTMKPIRLISNALLNSSLPKQICFDPFLGSGSTLIACEKLDRICFGIEIDPCYCDVIIDRYCGLTGVDKDDIYKSAKR